MPLQHPLLEELEIYKLNYVRRIYLDFSLNVMQNEAGYYGMAFLERLNNHLSIHCKWTE